tara:strand:+ start:1205 stop:2053 length:849 start_codon:yes stop_codon:yes gene_type:complete
MGKKRILYVSQEISPYTKENKRSKFCMNLPQFVQENDNDIRIFMPKFGTINERRHQLHEVIRLSGMNLIIDDFDHQLIIKVASIQQSRMQVYFIDNEEYFPKRHYLNDLEGNFMKNNDERMMFFCKGVIETVKKLGWAPDIIHCNGWFTSLVPMYIKKLYFKDPLFSNTKIYYTVFDNSFNGDLNNLLSEKLLFENLENNDVKMIDEPTFENLNRFAISNSDAVVQGSKKLNENILNYIHKNRIPLLTKTGGDNFEEKCLYFYENDCKLGKSKKKNELVEVA